MNAYDSLRKLLQTQAVQASGDFGLPLILENENVPVPKTGMWAEFWIRTGMTIRSDLGSGRRHFKKAAGVLQFTLYTPEKTGDGPILRMADNLEKRFSSTQFEVPPDGYITLDDATVNMMGKRENGYYCVVVQASFDFHYRDPDAVG
jgi:hypothetical protein